MRKFPMHRGDTQARNTQTLPLVEKNGAGSGGGRPPHSLGTRTIVRQVRQLTNQGQTATTYNRSSCGVWSVMCHLLFFVYTRRSLSLAYLPTCATIARFRRSSRLVCSWGSVATSSSAKALAGAEEAIVAARHLLTHNNNNCHHACTNKRASHQWHLKLLF